MRFRKSTPEYESLFRPAESLSVVDGPTRDALVAQFDAMTGRDTSPLRDSLDGVLWLGENRISYIRPADLLTGVAKDAVGVFQIDVMDRRAPKTVRNMRFQVMARALAEVGQEDLACLIPDRYAGFALPGEHFDPKPILPDAVEYAVSEMRWYNALEQALEEYHDRRIPRRRSLRLAHQ